MDLNLGRFLGVCPIMPLSLFCPWLSLYCPWVSLFLFLVVPVLSLVILVLSLAVPVMSLTAPPRLLLLSLLDKRIMLQPFAVLV